VSVALRTAVIAFVMSILDAPVSAHVDAVVSPDRLWKAWTFEPLIVLSILITGVTYAHGVRRLWAHAGSGRGVSYARALAFAAGEGALLLALISPLDALGGTLLSAHMAQHGLLVGVAPPLLLLGRPSVAFAWLLGRSAPSHPSATMMWRSVNAFARELATPLGATMLQGVVLWIWHAPALFDAALEHEWLHAMEHLCFFVSALLFWEVLLNCRSGRHSAAAFAAAFVTFMHSGLLGGLITMAPAPLYLSYVGRTESWGLNALEDQQLAGLFMWLPLGLPYLVAGLVLASGLVLKGPEDPGTRRLPVSSVSQR